INGCRFLDRPHFDILPLPAPLKRFCRFVPRFGGLQGWRGSAQQNDGRRWRTSSRCKHRTSAAESCPRSRVSAAVRVRITPPLRSPQNLIERRPRILSWKWAGRNSVDADVLRPYDARTSLPPRCCRGRSGVPKTKCLRPSARRCLCSAIVAYHVVGLRHAGAACRPGLLVNVRMIRYITRAADDRRRRKAETIQVEMMVDVAIMPGAEPYSSRGDRRGALVVHGLTGCPQSMRPLAPAFAAAGFTVELPRLPGHGTTPEDMAKYH